MRRRPPAASSCFGGRAHGGRGPKVWTTYQKGLSCPMNTAGWPDPLHTNYTKVGKGKVAVPRGMRPRGMGPRCTGLAQPAAQPSQPSQPADNNQTRRTGKPCLPYPDYTTCMQGVYFLCVWDGIACATTNLLAGLGWVKRAVSLPVLGTDLGRVAGWLG